MPLCEDYIRNDATEPIQPYTRLSRPSWEIDDFTDEYIADNFSFKHDPLTRIMTVRTRWTDSRNIPLTYEVLDSDPRAYIEFDFTVCNIDDIQQNIDDYKLGHFGMGTGFEAEIEFKDAFNWEVSDSCIVELF